MIIRLKNIVRKYDLKIKGVIHIGAHYGQEYEDYINEGIQNMMFFEPLKDNYEKLVNHLSPLQDGISTYNVALGNEVGEKEMFVETKKKGMCSSLLEPALHLKYSPTIKFDQKELVKIDKLDNIKFDHSLFNMINIDVQGYELEVFKGAEKTLKDISIIYSELNFEVLYKGCVLANELDEYLRNFGFIRIFTQMAHKSWGDGLYLKYW